MGGAPRGQIAGAVRAALGVGLFVFVLTRVDGEALREHLGGVRPAWLAIAFVLPHLAVWLSSHKWRWLLRRLDVHIGEWAALRLYLVGTFFNNFMPSTVGGDIIRAATLGRSQRAAPVMAATFTERYTGLLTLVGVAFLSLGDPRLRTSFPFAFPLLVTLAVALLVLGAWLLRGRPVPGLERFPVRRVKTLLRDSSEELRQLGNAPGALATAVALSVGFYAIAILTVLAAGRAVGVQLPLPALAGAVPLVLLFSMLPISLNGLGLSEIGYVAVLGALGVASPVALSIALILRARAWFTALLGAALLVSRGRSP